MITTGLTAEQVQLHSEHLASTTDFRVFPILVETVLYARPLVTLCRTRGLRSRPSKMMLAITLVMYGLSTWDWAIDIHLLRDDLKVFLPADLIQPPPDHARRLKVNAALHISQAITNNISVRRSRGSHSCVCDMVVCWRVYVVYGRNKRVLCMAVALLFALFCGILLCNLTQIGLAFPSVVPLHLLSPGELVIDIVTLILSALVNIWATSMIAYQAWRCRREIRHYLKDTTNRTFAESMLVLFAESGTVYTILWILKNIIILPVIEDTAYTDYASVVMYQMTGMYPTLIIILVALKKSHLENQFMSYGGATSHNSIPGGRNMVFGSGPTNSAWSPARFISPSGKSDIIVSTDIIIEQGSKTELGSSKDGEKSEV
ncbi:hypothetical protein B0H10DRAFT_2067672 [Mycena sp. CBHHK59/15]|nr:hypothetical protein B0H10DRAFT_2067672 [Mycena sp. CBHHK59/15]